MKNEIRYQQDLVVTPMGSLVREKALAQQQITRTTASRIHISFSFLSAFSSGSLSQKTESTRGDILKT